MRLILLILLLSCLMPCVAAPTSDTEPTKAALAGPVENKKIEFEPAAYPNAAGEARQYSPPPGPTQQSPATYGRSEYELGLTYALLGFAAVVILVLAFLASRAQKAWSPDSIVRVFGIAIIVPMAVILVVAGYSEKQIAPVIGLLGVIAGYLLGHTQRPSGGG